MRQPSGFCGALAAGRPNPRLLRGGLLNGPLFVILCTPLGGPGDALWPPLATALHPLPQSEIPSRRKGRLEPQAQLDDCEERKKVCSWQWCREGSGPAECSGKVRWEAERRIGLARFLLEA